MREDKHTADETRMRAIFQSYDEGVARLREEFLERIAKLRAQADEWAAKELGAAIRDKEKTYGCTKNTEQQGW